MQSAADEKWRVGGKQEAEKRDSRAGLQVVAAALLCGLIITVSIGLVPLNMIQLS